MSWSADRDCAASRDCQRLQHTDASNHTLAPEGRLSSVQEAANAAAVEFKTVVARMVEMPDGSSALGVCSSPTYQGPSTATGLAPKDPQPPPPPRRALWKACLAPAAVSDSPRASPTTAAVASEPPSPSQLSIPLPSPFAQPDTHCYAPRMARAQSYDSLGPQELRAICPHPAYLYAGIRHCDGDNPSSYDGSIHPHSSGSPACRRGEGRVRLSAEIVPAPATQPQATVGCRCGAEEAHHGVACTNIIVPLSSDEPCSNSDSTPAETRNAGSR